MVWVLVCFVLVFCFIFFKWEMLEHVGMLGLALFSYLCVYIVYVLYSTLVVMCEFWGCLPSIGAPWGQDCAFYFFCLASI